MAEQERKAKRHAGSEQETQGQETISASARLTDKGAKIQKNLDDILDEIDTILEDNAEEFVKSYVQRGGQ